MSDGDRIVSDALNAIRKPWAHKDSQQTFPAAENSYTAEEVERLLAGVCNGLLSEISTRISDLRLR